MYNGQTYWTMTPGYWSADYNYAGVFAVYSDGNLTDWFVDDLYNLRPVINLNANIKLSGNGTINDPYEVI